MYVGNSIFYNILGKILQYCMSVNGVWCIFLPNMIPNTKISLNSPANFLYLSIKTLLRNKSHKEHG